MWNFNNTEKFAGPEDWSPDGAYYFPALPYVSYTDISDDDLTAWWVYLRARPTQSRANQVH